MKYRLVKSTRRVPTSKIENLSANVNTTRILSEYAATKSPVSVRFAQIGTSVRPERATIINKVETVESFLARGGVVKTCKPTAIPATLIRVKGTRQTAKPFVQSNIRNSSIEVK
jgi:hypothetical protein